MTAQEMIDQVAEGTDPKEPLIGTRIMTAQEMIDQVIEGIDPEDVLGESGDGMGPVGGRTADGDTLRKEWAELLTILTRSSIVVDPRHHLPPELYGQFVTVNDLLSRIGTPESQEMKKMLSRLVVKLTADKSALSRLDKLAKRI